jgi:DNA-binding ferritin-like protein
VHLNTRSYSKHKALQKFYDGVVDLADTLAEAYQGRHGLIGPISLMSAKKTNNIVEFLEDNLKDIEEMRYKVMDKNDTALQNIVDEIVALYLSTLYKLKFLA